MGPMVLGDAVLLEWALEALVKNAIDALQGRGRHDYPASRSGQQGMGEIRVIDDGPGRRPRDPPHAVRAGHHHQARWLGHRPGARAARGRGRPSRQPRARTDREGSKFPDAHSAGGARRVIDTPAPDSGHALNPAQRKRWSTSTVRCWSSPGAGSGKTRVLTTRIAHLIDRHGVPARADLRRDLHQQGRRRDEAPDRAAARPRPVRPLDRHVSLALGAAASARGRAARLRPAVHHLRRGRPAEPDQAADGPARSLDQAVPAARGAVAHLVGQEPDDPARGARRRRVAIRSAGPGRGRRLRGHGARAQGGERDGFRRPAAASAHALPGAPRPAPGLPGQVQLRPGGRVPGHEQGAVRADPPARLRTATSSRSATTTSPSTAGAAPTSATCRSSSRTSPAPGWCGWRRTTARPRWCSTRPTASSPRTAVASGRRSRPAAGAASR